MATNVHRTSGVDREGAGGKKTEYLLFNIGAELFALEVVLMREIVDFKGMTWVPEAPEYMNGVINLRGRVVPVVDLCVKFGFPKAERTIDTRVIIVEVEHLGEQAVLGILVDAVQTVFEMNDVEVAAPPDLGSGIKQEYIKGVGKHGDDFVIILDLKKVLAYEELVEG